MRLQALAARRPNLFVVLVQIALLVVLIAAGAILAPMGRPEIAQLAGAGTTALLGAGLLSWLGWWRGARVRMMPQPGTAWLFVPAFLPILVNLGLIPLVGLRPLDVGTMLTLLAGALLVGFTEEVFYRGLMMRALEPCGARRAVVVTALLFAVVHALNALAGADPLHTALQIGYAFGFGLMFGALALRTGSIWPIILAHGLINFTGSLQSSNVTPALTQAVLGLTAGYIVLFAGYAVILMRGYTKRADEIRALTMTATPDRELPAS